MPRRTLEYKQLRALEEERYDDLRFLSALSSSKVKNSSLDPAGQIPGTLPEKMVYDYLIKLGVPFLFQNSLEDFIATAWPEDIMTPDFQLPDYGIIIEVFGQYWHSLLERREKDQEKMAYLQFFGYTTYEQGRPLIPECPVQGRKLVIWWEDEIYRDLSYLFKRDVPELLWEVKYRGGPGEAVYDFKEEETQRKRAIAGMITRKMRPKIEPYEKVIQSIYKRGTRFKKKFGFYRQIPKYQARILGKAMRQLE